MVRDNVIRFPNLGIRMVKGMPAAKGIGIDRERMRSFLWQIDPQGMLNRALYDQ